MSAGCATTPSTQPPEVKLDVPPAFQRSLAVHHFHVGEDVLHIDWMRTHAMAPMTRYEGDWPATATEAAGHHWTIDVYNVSSPKVTAAYAHANDGYDADLDELVDFLEPPQPPPPVPNARTALAYLFARFERKHFHWGNGVSFLSQSTQDTGTYAPMSTHLMYEVWGVTQNGRHTVVARVRVGHPQLANWPHVRNIRANDPELEAARTDAWNRNDYHQITDLGRRWAEEQSAALENDPDVKLIGSCNPNEFEPSLVAFDRLVDSLDVR